MKKRLRIRKPGRDDLRLIKNIEIDCGLSPWSTDDYLSELSRRDSLFFIAEFGREITGFALARLIMSLQFLHNDPAGLESAKNDAEEVEIEIYNIAVRHDFRKKKVGSDLFGKILDIGTKYNASAIHLEVRKSNETAQNFYLKHYFEITGERRNFYTDPEENAILMTRKLHFNKKA